MTLNLAFLASNNGTSMRAIVRAIETGELNARARLVVSNRRDSGALDFARQHAVPTQVLTTVSDPDGADQRLEAALRAAGADLVILSGYLRKLGPRVLSAFRNQILNVHPALLPDFGGQGMYGRRVHEAVLAAGHRVTGATVHIVDGEYDHGPILAQLEVFILERDDIEAVERRVMAAETRLFVDTLGRLARGELTLPVF